MKVMIYMVELGEVKNCWYRDFAVLIEDGQQKILFTSYPDHWEIYIKLRIYKFYYN